MHYRLSKVNSSGTGKISMKELRKSCLLKPVLTKLFIEIHQCS